MRLREITQFLLKMQASFIFYTENTDIVYHSTFAWLEPQNKSLF